MPVRNLLAGSAALLLSLPAFAAPWVVDPAHSTLTFEGSQKGASFQGGFSQFTCDIDFSEAAPEKGCLHITVAMNSLTTDDKDRMEALPGKDWFATASFPQAEFTSSHIVKTAEHQYAATGMLTLRGIAKEVTLPFTLTPEGTQTRAEGSVVLNRHDYQIGGGQWASDAWIAYPVTVHYRLLASAR